MPMIVGARVCAGGVWFILYLDFELVPDCVWEVDRGPVVLVLRGGVRVDQGGQHEGVGVVQGEAEC